MNVEEEKEVEVRYHVRIQETLPPPTATVINWEDVKQEPVVIHRTAPNHPRGRPYHFDAETLAALASLPQAPDDE